MENNNQTSFKTRVRDTVITCAEAYRAMVIAKILMDGGCKEEMGIYYIDDQEKYEETPTLEQCVMALEEQLALIGGEERYGNETTHLKNWLSDLRNGRWYKSSPEYDRPRIPKIEMTGEKIYSGIIDLVWKLDNGEKSSFEKMRDEINNASLSDLMPEDATGVKSNTPQQATGHAACF